MSPHLAQLGWDIKRLIDRQEYRNKCWYPVESVTGLFPPSLPSFRPSLSLSLPPLLPLSLPPSLPPSLHPSLPSSLPPSLQSGKVHFGYIYGVGLLGCTSMYIVLNLMSVISVSVGCVVSVLGYCLLPMVFLSCFSLIVSLQ